MYLLAKDFCYTTLVQEGRLAGTALDYVIRQLRLWAFILPAIVAVWAAIRMYGLRKKRLQSKRPGR